MSENRPPEPYGRWHVVGVPRGAWSWSVLAVLLITGTTWLTWPVWGSTTSPDHDQAAAEGPWLLGALVCGLVLLAVAMWRDAGRRVEVLSPIVTLVVANTLLRTVLTPGAAGAEPVFALPLLAGAALGAPAGFLVGAGSAICSTIVAGVPASMLATQALVWGLIGVCGGLLRRLRPFVAWVVSLPVAVAAGLMSGILLNLMGWGQEPGTTTTSFFPGLPPYEVATRLWSYTLETSLVYDLTRGVTTMLVVLAVGLPLLRALRVDCPDPRPTPLPAHTHDIRPEAVARREDRARLDRLWTPERPPTPDRTPEAGA